VICFKSRAWDALRIAFGFFLGAAVLARVRGRASGRRLTLLWVDFVRSWRAPLISTSSCSAAFCATALHGMPCAVRILAFSRFLLAHNFERYLTPVFQHPQPSGSSVRSCCWAILPWILFSVITISNGGVQRSESERTSSPRDVFRLLTAFPVLFFSLFNRSCQGTSCPPFPPLFSCWANGVTRSMQGDAKPALRGWGGREFSFCRLGSLYRSKLQGVRWIYFAPNTFWPGSSLSLAASPRYYLQ